MQLYSKDGLLFLIQVDHLSGEILGNVIESFYDAGAKNVQVVNALTKKNRPSYMIFVDAGSRSADGIEEVIVRELGSSGWHRIETCHRHTNVSVIQKELEIVTESEAFVFSAKGKVIDDDTASARAEYDDCARLKSLLETRAGVRVPLAEIQDRITRALRGEETEKLIFTSKD